MDAEVRGEERRRRRSGGGGGGGAVMMIRKFQSQPNKLERHNENTSVTNREGGKKENGFETRRIGRGSNMIVGEVV